MDTNQGSARPHNNNADIPPLEADYSQSGSGFTGEVSDNCSSLRYDISKCEVTLFKDSFDEIKFKIIT